MCIIDGAYASRGILHCVVPVEGVDVHCYVIHLGLFAGGRRRQTDALMQAVSTSSPPDAPLVIAGDFNDWTNQLSRKLYQNLDVVDVPSLIQI